MSGLAEVCARRVFKMRLNPNRSTVGPSAGNWAPTILGAAAVRGNDGTKSS